MALAVLIMFAALALAPGALRLALQRHRTGDTGWRLGRRSGPAYLAWPSPSGC